MRALVTTVDAALPWRVPELIALNAEIRQPLALSTRVGFVGVVGGAGCSVAAGLAASVLANRRSGRVLAVNSSGHPRSLLWHAGITADATSTTGQDSARVGAARAADALDGLTTSATGLHALDLGMSTDQRWWDAVAPGSRFFDFVVTDWGTRDAGAMGHVLASSTLLCLVSTPDRVALQHTADLAAAAAAGGVPSVLALMPARGRAKLAERSAINSLRLPMVRFPVDRAHQRSRPVPSRQLRTKTNLSAMRLSAQLVNSGRRRLGAVA